jgi:hypothetical protein
MEFNASGGFNGQQLDVAVPRLLPEKITGTFDGTMYAPILNNLPHLNSMQVFESAHMHPSQQNKIKHLVHCG